MPRFITKKWIELHDPSGSAEDRYKLSKQIRFKTSMLRSNLCDFSDPDIIVKGNVTVTDPNNNAYDKKLAFKIMHRLCLAFQKLIIRLLTILKIWIL